MSTPALSSVPIKRVNKLVLLRYRVSCSVMALFRAPFVLPVCALEMSAGFHSGRFSLYRKNVAPRQLLCNQRRLALFNAAEQQSVFCLHRCPRFWMFLHFSLVFMFTDSHRESVTIRFNLYIEPQSKAIIFWVSRASNRPTKRLIC